MATFELTGILKVKGQTVHVSPTFAKREFVIVEDPNGQFPQHIQLQLTQGNCDRLERFKVGDEITVKANIRGRQWDNPNKPGETKYFNTLDAWALMFPNEDDSRPTPESMVKTPENNIEPTEDLPF
jgi:hypothetical protein